MRMNKKVMTLIAAVAVSGSVLTAPMVLADESSVPSTTAVTEQAQTKNRFGAGNGPAFSDQNGDGVCDESGEGAQMRNRNGAGDGAGNGTESGKNFVDENEDGVCDNLADGEPVRSQDGSGNSAQAKNGMGQRRAGGRK